MSITSIRASSWAGLFDCPSKWEWTNILGHKGHSSPRATLGTAIHAGTAAFDTGRMTGQEISVYDAAGVFVDALQHPNDDVSWAGSDISQRQAEAVGVKLVSSYCREWSPRYQFCAVELQVKPLVIDCGGGTLIELTGTLDRARFAASGTGAGIKDLKSGARAVSQGVAVTKGHHAQIGTYELLFEHTTGQPITEDGEIIGLQTTGKGEIASGKIVGAKQMMVGTPEEPGLIKFGADMLRAGSFPPNPSSRLCDKRYCARWDHCRFHN